MVFFVQLGNDEWQYCTESPSSYDQKNVYIYIDSNGKEYYAYFRTKTRFHLHDESTFTLIVMAKNTMHNFERKHPLAPV